MGSPDRTTCATSTRSAVQLSDGQQESVAIAPELCMEPRILLFDEHTNALDPGDGS